MSKIRNTGAGIPTPPGGPDSTSPIQNSSAANETTHTNSESPSASQKPVPGDKHAAGDLKTKGDRLKSKLDSELQNKNKGVDDKELASQAAKGQQRFAPPYVPVGPVVMGDNIGVPGQTQKPAETGQTPEQKALAEKAAKDQVRFAPPYVPVGPVVMGDNISTPGHINATETRQMNLKADQFQINDQGNLVISNEKLVEYFKSLKEKGQEILLGITPKKPEDK